MYIFYIIKSSTDKFTLNNNGVWIDLTNINNNILMEIKKYADACIESKNILQKVNENMINEQTKITLKDNIDKEQSNLNNTNKFDFIKKFNEKGKYLNFSGKGYSISFDFGIDKKQYILKSFLNTMFEKYKLKVNFTKDLITNKNNVNNYKDFKMFKKSLLKINSNRKISSLLSKRLEI